VVADIATPADSEWPLQQPGPAFGDLIGGMTIAGGISAALFHRERTGEALVVDNSLLSTAMWAASGTLIAAGLFGLTKLPKMDRTMTPNPLVNNYRTSDGRFLSLIMLQPDRYWADLVTKLGHPELATDERFRDSKALAEHKVEAVGVLDGIFATRTFDEWREVLMHVDGQWAPVETAAELLADEQALANGYVREIEAASGTTFRIVPSPLQFNETPPDLTRAPEHGEHTDEVLQELLGLDMDRIMELKIAGAIL
jgi:crotonobetainyl-CoA:carnitine CoA-transferase CaiB-like acyl-CoA transferase